MNRFYWCREHGRSAHERDNVSWSRTKDEIIASEPSTERKEFIARTYGVRVTGDNVEAARNANLIVLAVKPNNVSMVIDELKPYLTTDHLLISIAAGVRIAQIESKLNYGVRVVRVMPNQPAWSAPPPQRSPWANPPSPRIRTP